MRPAGRRRVLALAAAALALAAGCAAPGPGAPGRIAPDTVPEPGTVGYLGDPAALAVVDGPGSAPPGTEWAAGVLRVTADDLVLERVHVRGPVQYDGSGVLAVRDSVVDGTEAAYSVITANSGHLEVSDSTVRWTGGRPGERWGSGAIQGDATMTVVRSDVSGAPDGIQNGPGDSTFAQNWIHDLVVAGTYPDNTHNDGIQNYGGADLVIAHNRIDISTPDGLAYDGEHQNAAVFVMPSTTAPSQGLRLVGNYLSGGGYTVRLGAPLADAAVVGNTFGPTAGGWGSILVDDPGGIRDWTGNTDASGATMVQP